MSFMKMLHLWKTPDGERKAVMLWGLARKSKLLLEGKDSPSLSVKRGPDFSLTSSVLHFEKT